MTEAEILAAILLDLGSRPGIRLFRNSVGVAVDHKGHRIRYGLVNGASDLIGWTTEEHDCCDKSARFVALEVKSATGRATPEQVQFLDAVTMAGGIGAVVRSVAEARKALGVV